MTTKRMYIGGGRLMLVMMLSIIAGSAFAVNKTVKLTAISCNGMSADTHNSQVVRSQATNDTTLVFPPGKFRLAPLTVANVNNFIMQGSGVSSQLNRLTRLIFSGKAGLLYVNVGNVTLDNFELEAPANANAVKIAGSGSLISPSLLVTSNISAGTESCLAVINPWFAPISGFITQ